MNNYFIAIKLPSEIVANVFPVGAQINEFSKATIVSYENLHLTLKFLGGALTFKQVEEVKQALRFVKLKPFSIQMRGTMAFPSTKFARVIGIGVEKSVHFLDLRKQVDDVLPPLTQADNREFIPHLTLARINSVFDKQKLEKFFRIYKETLFGNFEINAFYFMMSKPTEKGVKFEILEEYKIIGYGRT